MLLCFKVVGIAQLVEHLIERPGTILTQVQVPGVARDFLPASTSSANSLRPCYSVHMNYDTAIREERKKTSTATGSHTTV